MRLLFLSNVFPGPLSPGKGVFNHNMVRAVADNGHRVEVVAPIAWTEWFRASRERRQALKTHRGEWAGIPTSYPVYFHTPGVLRTKYGRMMWRGIRPTMEQAIERLRPEAIVAYWTHPDGECAVRAARKANIPAFVMSGGSDVLLLSANPSRRRAIERVLQDADGILTVNEDIQRHMIDAGIPGRKISVVRRGFDATRFFSGSQLEARARLGLPTDRPILLWVGRVEPVKGLPTLVEALELLRARGIEFHMLLVGTGELKSSLAADTSRRGLSDYVQWLGAVPHDQLGDYYRAADLTVLPSLSEGVPNVLIESIACGTPFVASAVGGIHEIASPGIDRLVPAGDQHALAEAIRAQLASPKLSGSRRFHPDDWPTAARRLIDVIESHIRTLQPASKTAGAWCRPATV
jgi:teichuronic acid biosynthesis glycosyltransferase TuaC